MSGTGEGKQREAAAALEEQQNAQQQQAEVPELTEGA